MRDGIQNEEIYENNKKLKQELIELAQQMDLAQQKLESKETNTQSAHQNPTFNMKEQQSQIKKLKNKIQNLQKQLQNNFDIDKITDKENQLKAIQLELQQLESENQSLNQINKNQTKAIAQFKDDQIEDKIYQIHKEILEVKGDNKKLQTQIQQLEKDIRGNHQSLIQKQEKIQTISQKLDKKNDQQIITITDEQIQILETKLQECILERENLEKQGSGFQKEQQKEKKTLDKEFEILQNQLRQLEKNIKLDQIKIKELKRQTKLGKIGCDISMIKPKQINKTIMDGYISFLDDQNQTEDKLKNFDQISNTQAKDNNSSTELKKSIKKNQEKSKSFINQSIESQQNNKSLEKSQNLQNQSIEQKSIEKSLQNQSDTSQQKLNDNEQKDNSSASQKMLNLSRQDKQQIINDISKPKMKKIN